MDRAQALATDAAFFTALTGADGGTLDVLLHERFALIDVLSGSEIPKAELVALVASKRLVFETIGPAGGDGPAPTVRLFERTAVVTGRTAMAGRFDGEAFAVRSAYTHVLVAEGARWVLANAQGTVLAPER